MRNKQAAHYAVGCAADKGARAQQEDRLGFRHYADGSLLAVLADGMGGHAGGAIASETAVRLFGEYYEKTQGSINARLQQTLHEVQQQLSRQAQAQPELATMGTTLLAVVIQPDNFTWISVGDSLLYKFSQNELSQCNNVHNLQNRFKRLLDAGTISPAEYAAVEEPYALTSALGPDKLHDIDNSSATWQADDVLLLASDGVLSLNPEELKAGLVLDKDVQPLAEALVQSVLAKAKVGQDNTSVIVIKQQGLASTQLRPAQRWPAFIGAGLVLSAMAGIVYLLINNQAEKVALAAKAKHMEAVTAAKQAELQAAQQARLAAEHQAHQAAVLTEQERLAKEHAQAQAQQAQQARARAEAKAQAAQRQAQAAQAEREQAQRRLQQERHKQLTPADVQPEQPAGENGGTTGTLPTMNNGNQEDASVPMNPSATPPLPVPSAAQTLQ